MSYNRLFVANKPPNIVCNHFLSRLKRKYGVKKAGFSGILDPFASGVLVVAFGDYTRLFRFLKKSPKTYTATIWLGAHSPSGDNQNISSIEVLRPFHESVFKMIISNLLGDIEYVPPKFSAKKIGGIHAYKLARNGASFEMPKQTMQVFESEILNYTHPFLTIKLSVSEGAYIRSYAQIFAQKLGCKATLCALKREQEGEFLYQDEKSLDPLCYLDLRENFYQGNCNDIILGKKLDINSFKFTQNGLWLVKLGEIISIFDFCDGEVKYELNKFNIKAKSDEELR